MATAGPWRAALEPMLGPAPVASAQDYHGWLAPLASSLDIWEITYLQQLQGRDPVKKLTKGTWLKQFLDALDPVSAAQFENDHAQRVKLAYPPQADGSTLFPFTRLFIVAVTAKSASA